MKHVTAVAARFCVSDFTEPVGASMAPTAREFFLHHSLGCQYGMMWVCPIKWPTRSPSNGPSLVLLLFPHILQRLSYILISELWQCTLPLRIFRIWSLCNLCNLCSVWRHPFGNKVSRSSRRQNLHQNFAANNGCAQFQHEPFRDTWLRMVTPEWLELESWVDDPRNWPPRTEKSLPLPTSKSSEQKSLGWRLSQCQSRSCFLWSLRWVLVSWFASGPSLVMTVRNEPRLACLSPLAFDAVKCFQSLIISNNIS